MHGTHCINLISPSGDGDLIKKKSYFFCTIVKVRSLRKTIFELCAEVAIRNMRNQTKEQNLVR